MANRGPGLSALNLLGYSIDRYKPYGGTPKAATVAVTRGRISLSPCAALWSMKIKNNIFGTQQRDSASRYRYGGGLGSTVTWPVAQYLNAPLSFWQRNPYQKRLHSTHIYVPKRWNPFCAIYFVRLALYACLKNICDGVGSQNGSNSTPLDPLFFGWTISLSALLYTNLYPRQ